MKIETWEAVDEAMEAYAAAQIVIRRAQAACDAACLKAEQEYQQAVRLARQDDLEISAALVKFGKAHVTEFKAAPDGDGRSYEHAQVILRCRKRPDSVQIEGEKAAVEYLVRFRPELVRNHPEADRPALLAVLQDSVAGLRAALIEHGISLKTGRDKFSVEWKSES